MGPVLTHCNIHQHLNLKLIEFIIKIIVVINFKLFIEVESVTTV